jgi:Tfp pilus assembly pilus retraction ATPase PilT
VEEFAGWLRTLVAEEGSDLHLKAGSPPKIRQPDGQLVALDHAPLTHRHSEFIEVLFRDHQSSINQREVGNDTESFESALRAALRQDPDVILIG